MMSSFAVGKYADLTEALFNSAEIEISGTVKPMELKQIRVGNKVRVFIKVPASEVGIITRRIVKDINNVIVWDDALSQSPYTLVKADQRDISLEIPVNIVWKGEV